MARQILKEPLALQYHDKIERKKFGVECNEKPNWHEKAQVEYKMRLEFKYTVMESRESIDLESSSEKKFTWIDIDYYVGCEMPNKNGKIGIIQIVE